MRARIMFKKAEELAGKTTWEELKPVLKKVYSCKPNSDMYVQILPPQEGDASNALKSLIVFEPNEFDTIADVVAYFRNRLYSILDFSVNTIPNNIAEKTLKFIFNGLFDDQFWTRIEMPVLWKGFVIFVSKSGSNYETIKSQAIAELLTKLSFYFVVETGLSKNNQQEFCKWVGQKLVYGRLTCVMKNKTD